MKYYKSNLLLKNKHGFFANKYNIKHNYDSASSTNNKEIEQNSKQEDRIPDRSKIANELGLRSEMLINLDQIHSNKIIKVEKLSNFIPSKADGMVTNRFGIGLCILTADCAPILLSDCKSGVIGAVHAGWRGALAGITIQIIQSMIDIGAKRSQITACIGPCISQKNYEVDPDFKIMFTKNSGKNKDFFVKKENEKFLFDLPNYLRNSLQKEKIQQVNLINICTYEEVNDFYSYRRSFHENENCPLRNISVIRQ